jgi:hypothetical protein
VSNKFKNEIFSSFEPSPVPTCNQCGKKLPPALTMLNPRNGKTLRIFKCTCGEQTWQEYRE